MSHAEAGLEGRLQPHVDLAHGDGFDFHAFTFSIGEYAILINVRCAKGAQTKAAMAASAIPAPSSRQMSSGLAAQSSSRNMTRGNTRRKIWPMRGLSSATPEKKNSRVAI